MTFHWRHYVTLANNLFEKGDEASLRSSISRAYYGAFCFSRNYLQNEGMIPTPRSSDELGKIHTQVIDFLTGSEDPDHNVIGQYLGELRRKRNKSDYDGNFNVSNENIIKLIKNANEIIDTISTWEA